MVLYGSGGVTFKFHYENGGSVQWCGNSFWRSGRERRRYHKPIVILRVNNAPIYDRSNVRGTVPFKWTALSAKVGRQKHQWSISTITSRRWDWFLQRLNLSETDEQIAANLKRSKLSLKFLRNVDTISNRPCRWNVIGGEAQRIRLATQIGSNLSGVLYILDEPSIGLHQRDNDRLIESLKSMRDHWEAADCRRTWRRYNACCSSLDWSVQSAGEFGGEISAARNSKEVERMRNHWQDNI